MMHGVKDPPLQGSMNNLWHENNSCLKFQAIGFHLHFLILFQELKSLQEKDLSLSRYFLIGHASGETSYGKYFWR